MHVSFEYPDFINHDARRFRVRVTDTLRTNANAVAARVCTQHPGPADPYTHVTPWQDITLPSVSPGVFVSTNLLLVSDGFDREPVTTLQPATGLSSRLFGAELGGTLRARYTDTMDEACDGTAEIGVGIKTVLLDVYIMRVDGTPAASQFDVSNGGVLVANERLAQANIRYSVNRFVAFDKPAGVPSVWNVQTPVSQANNTVRLTATAKAVMDAAFAVSPRTPGTVAVFYVPAPLYGFVGVEAKGVSASPSGYPYDSPGYLNSCFLTVNDVPITMAHEVLHVLLDNGFHHEETWNLMYRTGSDGDEALLSDKQKRLTASQIETARGSVYAQ